jgi:hypothetical protein
MDLPKFIRKLEQHVFMGSENRTKQVLLFHSVSFLLYNLDKNSIF